MLLNRELIYAFPPYIKAYVKMSRSGQLFTVSIYTVIGSEFQHVLFSKEVEKGRATPRTTGLHHPKGGTKQHHFT